MIKIEKIKVEGLEAAIRGMRNPLESHDRIDSYYVDEGEYIVGENDKALLTRLTKAGAEHRKALRYITITMDVTAPLFFWKEYDTYKIATVANSTSTMHTIHKKEIGLDCMSIDSFPSLKEHQKDIVNSYIGLINEFREEYLKTKGKNPWRSMIELLPSSWNQTRTLHINFEVALNQIGQRENHKLYEWNEYREALLSEIPLLNHLYNALSNKAEPIVVKVKETEKKPKYLIILDAGHGMDTFGKETPVVNGQYFKERELNEDIKNLIISKLSIVNNVDVLDVSGEVLYERSLQDRVILANSIADNYDSDTQKIYVSIHHNAYGDGIALNSVNGIESFYSSDAGKKLATAIHNNILSSIFNTSPDRGIKDCDFYVIKNTAMPAVLIECGFMTGSTDFFNIIDKEYKKKIAQGITRGVFEYFR